MTESQPLITREKDWISGDMVQWTRRSGRLGHLVRKIKDEVLRKLSRCR